MRRVFVARHAHREDFEGEHWGATWAQTAARPHDPALSPRGEREARALARRLAGEPIRHIFASPFLRTVQTAAIVAEQLDLDVKIEEGLSEWLNPEWFPARPEPLDPSELARRFGRIDLRYLPRGRRAYPEAEERAHVAPAVATTVRALLNDFAGDLLLVGHDASVRAAVDALAPGTADWQPGLCSVSILEKGEEGWRLALTGCTRHLGPSGL